MPAGLSLQEESDDRLERAPLIKSVNGAPDADEHRLQVPDAPTKIHLTFRDVSYEVKLSKKKEAKRILQGVSGSVHGGQMMAILGPSGAGKTTMLDILAQRQKGGTVSGELLMNGHPIVPGIFRRVSAYVQQEDIMHGYLTVRETIRYSARLRLPKDVDNAEVDRRTTQTMKMLGIDHVADRKIGTEFVRGISGGEKKRTAIGVELVTNPSLLYLDEPTTGLDTFTALHLLYILRRLASQGTTVVFSIHQPRSSIFRLFDTVLLLNGFGEEAFFGPASEAVAFLTAVGVPQKYPDNPADFLLDSVSVVRAAEDLDKADFPFLPPPTQSQDIAAAFRSTKLQEIYEHVDAVSRLYANDSRLPAAMDSPYHRSVWEQVYVVSQRAVLNRLRDPIATFVAIVVAVFFAVLIGSIYYQLPLSKSGQLDRMGVLFFLSMNTAFSNLGSLAIFLFDRSIYTREHRNGMYRPSAYYLGKLMQDLPLSISVNFVFDIIAYYMIGLQPSFGKFGYFFLIATLMMLNSYGMCLFISSWAKNYQVANLIAPLLMVLFLLPSGFLINLDSIPLAWRWLKYISFFRYGFEALVINEFDGLTFHICNATAVSAQSPCEGAGSSSDALAKIQAQYGCNPMGADLIVAYGFNVDHFTNDIIYCGVSAVTYMILGYIFLRAFRSNEGK